MGSSSGIEVREEVKGHGRVSSKCMVGDHLLKSVKSHMISKYSRVTKLSVRLVELHVS